jgi:ADP-ribosylglycohydrolase
MNAALPDDYSERVYAGVLGKIIGVYLGRPFEGWTYERIMAELGEVTGYLHARFNMPLVVTDDDISGTFTFLRALEDYGYSKDLTSAQIGQTWLNYLLEGRTILWWGGLGMSTEHTAYLRLKAGIQAPASGSIALNGSRVAEQIGAQIFIDGWGMIAPGQPAMAADFAKRAAQVSHDSEAVYAAQVIAVIEAQAFVEKDIGVLLDTALSFIPPTSTIARVIHDLRTLREHETDWHKARAFVAANYGYDKYGGACHVVPNHALIILALLYGNGNFDESLKIVNTCGWDTDCNSANVGCILGIRNGLGDIGKQWREPVADQLLLPTADGGRAVSDAVIETYHVVNSARALQGLGTLHPKGGARFHFELPGSVQGFQSKTPKTLTLANVSGHSTTGQHSLALRYQFDASEDNIAARLATATFSTPEALALTGKAAYDMIASPTLYPGQHLSARVVADAANNEPVTVNLFLSFYNEYDTLSTLPGPDTVLQPGQEAKLEWTIPDVDAQPIAEIGFELRGLERGGANKSPGVVYLDFVAWSGTPRVTFTKPALGGTRWRQAWVNGVDKRETHSSEPFRLIQNEGRGLISQGTRDWKNYRVEAVLTPHLSKASGLGIRVQGMQRYYALLLCLGREEAANTLRLIKRLDGETVLDEAVVPWEFDTPYTLALEAEEQTLRAYINGDRLFKLEDKNHPLRGGAVALLCEEGMMTCETVMVSPVEIPNE